jgi:hypothetical protein
VLGVVAHVRLPHDSSLPRQATRVARELDVEASAIGQGGQLLSPNLWLTCYHPWVGLAEESLVCFDPLPKAFMEMVATHPTLAQPGVDFFAALGITNM